MVHAAFEGGMGGGGQTDRRFGGGAGPRRHFTRVFLNGVGQDLFWRLHGRPTGGGDGRAARGAVCATTSGYHAEECVPGHAKVVNVHLGCP